MPAVTPISVGVADMPEPLDIDLATAIAATQSYAQQALDARDTVLGLGALRSANNLSDLGNAATARTNLGLGSAATHAATDFDASGAAAAALVSAQSYADAKVTALINSAPSILDTLGEIATQLQADESVASALATTVSGKLAKASNLSDLADVATARSNLGLGTAALLAASALLLGANNLSDIANAATARTNLGLGALATLGAGTGLSSSGGNLVLGDGATIAYTSSLSTINLMNDSAALYLGAASDVVIKRDAANTLALRAGANAQAFNVYNTRTDASNYERGALGWSSNVFTIGTEKAGTGSTRNLKFIIGGTTKLDYGVTNANAWSVLDAFYTNGHTVLGGLSYVVNGINGHQISGGPYVHGWASTSTVSGSSSPDTGLSRSAAGVVAVGTGAAGSTAGWLLAAILRTVATTVASLPSASSAGAGARAFVTDATSTTFGAAAAGSGTNAMPVWSNGTGWFIG